MPSPCWTLRRNDMARGLRQRSTSRTLGLLIEDVANPFYSAITRAVEEVARRSGFLVITGSSDEDPVQERALVGMLCERRVDGLILVPAGADHSYLIREMQAGTPVVFLDRPPGNIDGDMVLIDNRGGARTATEHLLAQGHRRVGMIGHDLSVFTAAERLAGYRAALRAHGIRFDNSLVVSGANDIASGEREAQALLIQDDPPTAIFCANNRITVGALRVLYRGGSRGVALVGFDDFELAVMLEVPVTVVAYDPAELGQRAAELLCARIDGDERPPQRVVVPTHLVQRGSGKVKP
jgi:LacI family transcriptional regulator